MFCVASSFNQGIGGWETSQLRSMSYMFLAASGFNQGTGSWNKSQVSDISSFNQGIGGWNTSQASDNGPARGDLHLPPLLGRGRKLLLHAEGHLLPHGVHGQCTGNKDFQETFTGAVSQSYSLFQLKVGIWKLHGVCLSAAMDWTIPLSACLNMDGEQWVSVDRRRKLPSRLPLAKP